MAEIPDGIGILWNNSSKAVESGGGVAYNTIADKESQISRRDQSGQRQRCLPKFL